MPKLTPRYGVTAMTRNRAMTAEGKTVPMLAMRATAGVITLTVSMATAKAAAPQAVAPGRSSKLFRLGRDRRERNKSKTSAIVQATFPFMMGNGTVLPPSVSGSVAKVLAHG